MIRRLLNMFDLAPSKLCYVTFQYYKEDKLCFGKLFVPVDNLDTFGISRIEHKIMQRLGGSDNFVILSIMELTDE